MRATAAYLAAGFFTALFLLASAAIFARLADYYLMARLGSIISY